MYTKSILILNLLISITVFAQKKKESVSVEVVSFTVDKYDLRVEYKIVNGEDQTFYNIQGELVDSAYKRHPITQATGDFGNQVLYTSGKATYHFDYKTTTTPIEKGVFKIMLTVEKSITNKKLGGPEKALLSLALPGLGDKYVYYRNITGPVFTTVTLGLLAGGIYTKIQSKNSYNDYQDAIDQEDIDRYYDKANSQYKLGNALLTAAAVVWLADIASVAYKGHKNKRNATASGGAGASVKSRLDWNLYPVQHMNIHTVAFQLKLNF